jgi:succinyl-diaminopimelate desuccinylase
MFEHSFRNGRDECDPRRARGHLQFPACAASSRESLQQRLEAVLVRHGLDYKLVWTGWGDPYLTPKGRLVDVACDVVRNVTGITPEVSRTGGTSDGRFIATICREVVELGPVGASIHKLNERVRIADLALLSRIYRGTLERLLIPAASE